MCKKDSCCQKSDSCATVGYGEVLRLQTCADLSCALCLVTALETVLSQDSIDAPPVPSLSVKLAAQNLQEFLKEHASTLATTDDNGTQDTDTPSTYGVYTYLDCVCKKLPLLWRECIAKGQDPQQVPVEASIFDLALDTPTAAYATVNAQAFLEAVCCLKRHYQLLKSVLNCC